MAIDYSDLIPTPTALKEKKPKPKKSSLSYGDLIERKLVPSAKAMDFQDLVPKEMRVAFPKVDPESLKSAIQVMAEAEGRLPFVPETTGEAIAFDPNKPLGFVDDIIPPTGIPEIADPQDISLPRTIGKEKPIGLRESIRREGAWGVTKRLPFIGPSFGAMKDVEIGRAAKRLQANTYEQMYAQPREKWTMQMIVNPHPSHLQREDKKLIMDYFNKLDEESKRDRTFWAKVGSGALDLAPWMVEFAATGGLANLGSGATRKFGEKLIGQYAKTKTGQLALRSAGWLGGAAARTTAGLPHRVAEQYARRRLPEGLTVDEQGQVGFRWPQEKPFTSFAKAWGNVFVEAASEEAGQTITKGLVKGIGKMPFGSKFLIALRKAWTKLSPDNSMMKFWQQLFRKGGYSNLIGEIGEERLATIMHSIAGTESFGVKATGNPLVDIPNRLVAGFEQDIKNFPVEATVLSIPGATRFALGRTMQPPTEAPAGVPAAPPVMPTEPRAQPEAVEVAPLYSSRIQRKKATIKSTRTSAQAYSVEVTSCITRRLCCK